MSSYLHALDAPDFTENELAEFIISDVGVPISHTRIDTALRAKELRPLKIQGNNRFTRRQGLEWLARIFREVL